MSVPPGNPDSDDARAGLLAGIAAYCAWGIFPIYFKQISSVSPFEILAHRIIWAVPFALGVVVLRRQWGRVGHALKDGRLLFFMALSSLALAVNWGVYVWAVVGGEIFQASLGYYINPIMYVLVGIIFFREKLSRLQSISVLLAFIGVGVLTIYGGVVPYTSLILAISFSVYGVIRKKANIGAIPGLVIETMWLFLPAVIYLWFLNRGAGAAFAAEGISITFLLILAGPLTIMPLWGFAFAARRLKLSTLGMLQYIGPTGQFLCALYYQEVFTPAHAWCFTLIWGGIALFSYDAYRRRSPAREAERERVAGKIEH